ncbi:MAG TPA: PP2C family protein-serine/threonine phosphatase, partial [Pirellulaceae bacterium]|nr:PP2C family protein-serine/threonine phosphatase [Pirellulaceae bacterium]
LFHGVATRLREVMKRNVNTIRQARSVRQMSQQLSAASQRGGFASTLMSTYFAPTRSFALCNAGHPPPMMYRMKTRQWSLMKQQPAATVTGGSEPGVVDPSEYQQFKTTLEVGDMVLTFSNSLTESRTRDGQTLGVGGLLDRVRQCDSAKPSAIPETLLNQLKGGSTNDVDHEDATVMLCQATETPVAWRDNLLAPFRLIRGATDRTSFT